MPGGLTLVCLVAVIAGVLVSFIYGLRKGRGKGFLPTEPGYMYGHGLHFLGICDIFHNIPG
jgi:hypothetical protein